jgi:hypothetical protein
LSRYGKLHRYFPGAVAELAEQRKTKAYSRLWNVEAERARLIFFAVELSGCFGPEAQQMCKTVVEMGEVDRRHSGKSMRVSPLGSK